MNSIRIKVLSKANSIAPKSRITSFALRGRNDSDASTRLFSSFMQKSNGNFGSIGTLSLLSHGKSRSHGYNNDSSSFDLNILVATSALIGGSAAVLSSVNKTSCEEGASNTKVKKAHENGKEKVEQKEGREEEEAAPSGVSDEDVEFLVQEILKDPSINLSMVPDWIEGRIYKSTVQLTLNIVLRLFTNLNGVSLLAHEIQTKRQRNNNNTSQESLSSSSPSSSSPSSIQPKKPLINDQVLERVATRLLANKNINSVLIPDAIERQIYINCLKVIFRALDIITESICITVCGHDLKLVLEPSQAQASLEKVSSSLSAIDLQKLQEFAKQSGVDENLSFWESLWLPQKHFMTQLHVSLYALILGIVDDLMANTTITILSDEITLDIVAATPKPIVVAPTTATNIDKENQKGDEDRGGSDVGYFAAASFAAGIGVGVAAMAVASHLKP